MRLTRKGFEAWLRGKNPRDVVGYPGSCRTCPIGRCRTETNTTWPRQSAPAGWGPWYRWARKFTIAVDETSPSTHDFIHKRITAARALKILGDI